MAKRILLLLLCVVLLCSTTAYAVEPRANYADNLTLDFSGTTATCNYKLVSAGDTINVTMKLWQGDTLVDLWTKTGTSAVNMSETCQVSRLKMYTLEVSGTCGGVAFGPVSVSKRCPLFG